MAYELRISYWSSDVCSSDLCDPDALVWAGTGFERLLSDSDAAHVSESGVSSGADDRRDDRCDRRHAVPDVLLRPRRVPSGLRSRNPGDALRLRLSRLQDRKSTRLNSSH